MCASGLGSVAKAERTEATLQEESSSRTWFWVILLAMAVVLFGVILAWKQYKKLGKRMEENELALNFLNLGIEVSRGRNGGSQTRGQVLCGQSRAV